MEICKYCGEELGDWGCSNIYCKGDSSSKNEEEIIRLLKRIISLLEIANGI